MRTPSGLAWTACLSAGSTFSVSSRPSGLCTWPGVCFGVLTALCACCALLVSNAGMGLIGPIECQSLDEMRTVMDTNFFGLVRLVKEILPDMKRRKKGHIVVISSVMGIQGGWFQSGHHDNVCWGKTRLKAIGSPFSCRNSIQRHLRSIQICSGRLL